MNNGYKKCSTCNSCKRVYERTAYGFMKSNYLYCIYHNKIIDLKYTCNYWSKKEIQYEITVERIDDVEEDVMWLIKHLRKLF